MRRRSGQRRNVRAKKISLSIFDEDVRFLQLSTAGTQALHFPTHQRDSCFVRLFDEVVVSSTTIIRDERIVTGCGFLSLLRVHEGADCSGKRLTEMEAIAIGQ